MSEPVAQAADPRKLWRDGGSLPCPDCGKDTVLSTTEVMVLVGPGRAGRVWGNPEILLLSDREPAQCNDTHCGWTGTVRELREHHGQAVV